MGDTLKKALDGLQGKAVKMLRLPTVGYDLPIQVIPAKEGDAYSRCFIIELYDTNGTINLEQYSTVTFNAKRPDGETILDEAEFRLNDKGEKTLVFYEVPSEMTYVEGRVECDIALVGTDANGEHMQMSSQTFYVIVAPSNASNENIEVQDTYPLLLRFVTQEEARVDAENLRVNAESGRKTAEEERVKAEESRVKAEEARVKVEETRVEAENSRKTAEEARVKAEEARVEAEESRVKAEKARVKVEETRVEAENSRKTAEEARAKAEEGRVKAESARVEAETERATIFASLKSNCEKATDDANTATDNANDKIEEIRALLSSSPCTIGIKEGGTLTGITSLTFVLQGD